MEAGAASTSVCVPRREVLSGVNTRMEELQILATLIQHADKQIDASMNMFLVLTGIMATFTMIKPTRRSSTSS